MTIYETWHRVAWSEGTAAVDHATEALAEKHAAELRAAGHKPLVYAVQIEAIEEAL